MPCAGDLGRILVSVKEGSPSFKYKSLLIKKIAPVGMPFQDPAGLDFRLFHPWFSKSKGKGDTITMADVLSLKKPVFVFLYTSW